jgi:perosamine synthetase
MITTTAKPTFDSKIDVAQVVAAIREVLGKDTGRVALHEPWFVGNERAYVQECIDTGWVSSVGKFVDRLEEMLAEYTGASRAVAVCNGTSALHLCLKLAGVEAGDEVLVPALTFVATANAVAYCGATPHFVDSSADTFGMCADKLDAYLAGIADVVGGVCVNKQTGKRIRAALPMHTFGFPVDLDPLLKVCELYSISLIEDAAESLGSFYRGKHTGTFGMLGVLSFNGNKIMTTGGGGAILTKDPDLGARAKHLSTTAREAHRWTFLHNEVGYNHRMPNLNAALGCAQLEQLPRLLRHKRTLAERYQHALAEFNGVHVAKEPRDCSSNYWLNCLLLESGNIEDRDRLLTATNDDGIMTRPVWKLMHKLPMYGSCPRMDLSVAERLEASIVNLPSSSFLNQDHD